MHVFLVLPIKLKLLPDSTGCYTIYEQYKILQLAKLGLGSWSSFFGYKC